MRTLGLVWDDSARKQLEAELAEQKELAEVTLGSIGDGVISTDAQGRVRFMNRVAEELTSWTAEKAEGIDIAHVVRLLDEADGKHIENPAHRCLRERSAVGVSSHAQLLARAVLARRQGEMQWMSRLTEALDKNQFRLFAQPIVALNGAADNGAGHQEVLLRIASAVAPGGDGLVLPGAFIPAAERYDLMVPLDRWVVSHVCRHIHEERRRGERAAGPVPMYSVNLSGVSLGDDGMLGHITSEIAAYGIAPGQLCFEITETAVIANLPKAQEFIASLRALGCHFSLDDFGSGLSSFAYLRTLPVDYLKIDGLFIRGIAGNDINRALVKAINEVGHVMGIRTVAEYVEDKATLAAVRDLGTDYAQGYAVGQLRQLA